MSRNLKTICTECNAPAIIRKTNRKTPQFADLYCQCTDVECGHTFVMNMTFSHTLSPSAKSGQGLVKTLLTLLKPEDKQLMINFLQTQTT